MANTYAWIISSLECIPEHEGKTDVVSVIHWRRTARNNNQASEIYGAQNIAFNADDSFTPYKNLTETQVIKWLESALGSETCAAQIVALDKQIDTQTTPIVTTPELPW